MPVAAEHFVGVAFAPESAFKVAGTWVNPKGYKKNVAVNPSRQTIAREDASNSKGDRYADTPGMQMFDGGVEFDIHSGTYSDLKALIKGALGEEETGGALGFTSSASNTQITHTGAPSSLVRVIDDAGTPKTHYLPVDTNAAGVSVLAVGLDTGRVATDIDNPSTLSGGSFRYSLGDVADTFSFEFDWRNRPSSSAQENILAKACAVTSMQLIFEREKRLSISFKVKAAEYTEGTGPATNITDPGVWTVPFIGWAGDWILTKSATPKITDTKTRVKKFTAELAAPTLDETGAIGIDGGSTSASVLPGSDIFGYTRDPAFAEKIKVVVPYDATYVTDYKAGTAYKLYFCLYPGIPNATATLPVNRVVGFFRRLVQSERPKIVMDGGYRCHELTFQAERDLTANTVQERFSLAFINA